MKLTLRELVFWLLLLLLLALLCWVALHPPAPPRISEPLNLRLIESAR